MDVYLYQAALYCEECGSKIIDQLNEEGHTEDTDDEGSYDSDDYPKGPYPYGGGEADCPQHCAKCQCFLENPLTDKGKKYAQDKINNYYLRKSAHVSGGYVDIILEWQEFYGINNIVDYDDGELDERRTIG